MLSTVGSAIAADMYSKGSEILKLARFFRHPAFLCFPVLVSTFAGAASAEQQASLVSGLPFAPGDAANGRSRLGDATPDGRFVAISSTANNLHAGEVDVNADEDVSLLDRSSGEWQLISHRFGNPHWSAAGRSAAKALSADGRFVLFESYAADLIATPQAASVSY